MKESIKADQILFRKVFVMHYMAFELSEDIVPRVTEENGPHQGTPSNGLNGLLNCIQKFASEGGLRIQIYRVSFNILPKERMEIDIGSHPQA